MMELTEQGELQELIPELVQTVLECITVKGNGEYEIRFLDGTAYEIKL